MQVVSRASARTPRKADYSPFHDFLSLCGIIRRQMCIQGLKAVGMPYDDTSSIASLPSCE